MDQKNESVSIVQALRTKFYVKNLFNSSEISKSFSFGIFVSLAYFKFQNEQKEMKLFKDVCNESIVRRAVPITVTLSITIYYAIRHGFLRVSF